MENNSVCFVIHSLQAGGMERVMSELVNYFSATKKYQVHLVLYGIKRDVFYPISNDIIVHKPSFEFDNSKRLISTFKTIRFLRTKIKEINPISVLSFGERWNNLVLLSLYGTKIPVFVSDRSQPDKSLGFKDDFLRKMLYPNAKGVIVQTEKALEIFQKMYRHTNFKVIGNPIRQIENTVLEKENYILMVSRYIESKQQNKLIEIFSKLNAPSWKLVLLGYDHLKQSNQVKWEKLATDLNISDRVIFTGKQADVEYYYNISKVFAFTSVSEGFPNVIGEAMSAGLPIIAFDCVAGPSDLISDNENGFLIPLDRDEIFVQKLQYLIDNPEIRNKFGEKSKINIKQFELNYICRQFENFIVPLNKLEK
jgi:GalNAc-alpha-(1->4)-GalNAc-alpha-(1->3)-diNAcBac-PP-undecaprenol alpha-1,4-N-acetyl-D-galactosaminyltransferase